MQKFFMLSLIQEVHRREQEIVEKNQNLVEMKRKNQTVSIILIIQTEMSMSKLDQSKSGKPNGIHRPHNRSLNPF